MSVRKITDSKGRSRWQAYVYDSTAKRSVYAGTFERQKDAEEAAYEMKRRLRLGERLKPREEITFEALSKRWYDGLVSVRPATKVDYDKALRRLRPYFAGKLVSSITRRDVDAMVTGLSDQYAASTVRKTVVVFKMVMRMGVDHDHLERMPLGSGRLALPKSKKRVFEPLTPQQVRKLIDCSPMYWRPFVQLLVTSGLRRAEAWGLRVEDLDLERGCVRVRGQLIKRRLVDLKTDAAHRDVPLPRQTLDVLRAHLPTVPENELGLLFPTPEGKPVDPPNFYARVWMPTREKAGLPKLRMHDCRHHVASVYLAQGRSITYVQRLLGHSNPSTLLSIYSWVTKDEAEVATPDFEKWLGEEEVATYLLHARVA